MRVRRKASASKCKQVRVNAAPERGMERDECPLGLHMYIYEAIPYRIDTVYIRVSKKKPYEAIQKGLNFVAQFGDFAQN